MRQFAIVASLIGGVSAFFGFWIAYHNDWPVGPTDVLLLGIFYAVAFAGWRVYLALRPGRSDPARL